MRVSENVDVVSGPDVAGRSLKRTGQVPYQEMPIRGTAGISRLNQPVSVPQSGSKVRKRTTTRAEFFRHGIAFQPRYQSTKLNSLPNARRIRRSHNRKFAG